MRADVRWTDRIQSQTGDWSGNVLDFFTRVSAKFVLDLKKPFKLVNMVRMNETPIHDAVREALVKCLVSSDFYEPRGVVKMVYAKLKENPSISQKQVAEDLEISVKQVKNVTDKLQKQGRIKRIGSAHGESGWYFKGIRSKKHCLHFCVYRHAN